LDVAVDVFAGLSDEKVDINMGEALKRLRIYGCLKSEIEGKSN